MDIGRYENKKAYWSTTRYSWIVHPLAYRDWLNKIPDNSVDAMQWSIMNINTNEQHYQVYKIPRKQN